MRFSELLAADIQQKKTSIENGLRVYMFRPEEVQDFRISVVTTTFNSAATIADALESVKSQDYKNLEHIVVDGGSKDGTLNIIKSYPHINKWISERDSGLYEAMNKGINLASGDVVGILNSDDFYANSKVLTKVASCFISNNTDAVYSDLHIVSPINTDRVVRKWRSGYFKPSSFYYGWMPPHPTFFVRRSAYEKFGLFNLSLKSSADYELMLRMLLKYRLNATYIPEVLVKMRAGGASNVSLFNRIQANREDRQAWKLNGISPYFFTLFLKPLRKVAQFIR